MKHVIVVNQNASHNALMARVDAVIFVTWQKLSRPLCAIYQCHMTAN